MDDVDRKILELLIENSKTSYKEIASKVGISDVAVHKRIKRMQKGVIRGFTALIEQGTFGLNLTCLVSIKCVSGEKERIAGEIAALEEVREVYTTIGEQDIIAKIRTRDISSLKELVDGKISSIKGIDEIRSSIVFNCLKEEVWLVH